MKNCREFRTFRSKYEMDISVQKHQTSDGMDIGELKKKVKKLLIYIKVAGAPVTRIVGEKVG